jgi:hypothetical protein
LVLIPVVSGLAEMHIQVICFEIRRETAYLWYS